MAVVGLVHWDDVEQHRGAKGEMDATWQRLGQAAGAKGVGLNRVRVAAGVGDRARLVCGYAPTTVNLHDVLFAVHGDRVVDVWPVFPRGPQHCGFLGAFSGS